MTSAKLAYQVLALLSFSVFIQSTECQTHVRGVNLSAPETFVQSVFDEFGSNNSSMNAEQFNLLLRELNIGSSSNEQASENGKVKVAFNMPLILQHIYKCVILLLVIVFLLSF